jgi:hypothetical protein
MLLERIVSPIYTWLLILIYALYISAALGVWFVHPEMLHALNIAMESLVAGVLVVRFHPFRHATELRPFEQRLIFASGFMLLVNAALAWKLL